MYHPLPPSAQELAINSTWTSDSFEFLELTNASTDLTLDLAGARFSDGIEFDFAQAALTTLAPQQSLLLVKDRNAFESRYGSEMMSRVAGEFQMASGLRDSGEVLKLDDATQSTVFEFAYDDNVDRRWPARADGLGSSLQIVGPERDPAAADSWQPSLRIHGTPGDVEDVSIPQVVINEVLSHPVTPSLDAVELFHAGSTPVDLGFFYLSDDATEGLEKFRLAAGTLEPGQFLVLDEQDFGLGDPHSFGLSGTHGDQLFLTWGDAERPIWFVDDVTFPAAAAAESFGRHSVDRGRHGAAVESFAGVRQRSISYRAGCHQRSALPSGRSRGGRPGHRSDVDGGRSGICGDPQSDRWHRVSGGVALARRRRFRF